MSASNQILVQDLREKTDDEIRALENVIDLKDGDNLTPKVLKRLKDICNGTNATTPLALEELDEKLR